jgi:hypothetical protein
VSNVASSSCLASLFCLSGIIFSALKPSFPLFLLAPSTLQYSTPPVQHRQQPTAYNSHANGIVEHQHCTIQESLVKACNSDVSRWPALMPLNFWADHITIHKSTGYSPFYMAHSIEPILPFNITFATFLVPDLTKPLSTADLITTQACQLKKYKDDLAAIQDNILKSRITSIQQSKCQYENTIQDFNFKPGTPSCAYPQLSS